ncbi:MAG: DinB family protein [bacterium]|nr:DinB family protein [bacterium]
MTRPAPGKWSAKELLGHLIDSASNNHPRFVRAALKDDLVFEGYDQDQWVAAQGNHDMPWDALVGLWGSFNLHLARVMEAVPAAVRGRACRVHNFDTVAFRAVPAGEPVTLEYLMADYVVHMEYHLGQFEARLGDW